MLGSLSKLLQNRVSYRCFTVNFGKILRTPFIQNTSRLLDWYNQENLDTQVQSQFSFQTNSPRENAIQSK